MMPGVGAIKKIPDWMREKAGYMKYNPLVTETHTDTGLIKYYPDLYELEDIQVFMAESLTKTGREKDPRDAKKEHIFKNRALRYMIWLYSKDSILNTKPQEPLKDRKYKALDLAGFQHEKGKSDYPRKVIGELVELRNPKFLRAVLAFLRDKMKNELWHEIIATEEQHQEAMRLRMTPVAKGNEGMKQADHKKKLAIICKELMIDIRQYWDEFWEDHIDVKKEGHEEIYMTIEDRARINTGV